jgi:hypothetical protein
MKRLPVLLGALAVAALAATPASGQRPPSAPKPPWVLETRNVVPINLPAALLPAIEWDGIRSERPLMGAVADLNEDGVSDYLLKGGADVCDIGGCLYGIIDGKSRKPIGEIWGDPLIVRGDRNHGFHTIDSYSQGSARSGTFATSFFDGLAYVNKETKFIEGRQIEILFWRFEKLPRWPPATAARPLPATGAVLR